MGFEIAKVEQRNLDDAEGVGSGYDRIDDVHVALMNGEEVLANTYIATKLNELVQPHDWYRAYVIAGAMQHGLPKEWIARIEATKFGRDPNLKRRESALQTLKTAGYEEFLESVPA